MLDIGVCAYCICTGNQSSMSIDYIQTLDVSITWRIKTNNNLNKLIGNKTIINHIKSQRLGWLGHVHRMPDERMVKKSV
jgi:hypothetical protein